MEERMLSRFIARNHHDTLFTDGELKAIKDGNIDELVSTFISLNSDYYTSQLQCTLNSLKKFLGQGVELESITYLKEYTGNFIGCQIMDGDIDVFLGVSGESGSLLELASIFADEQMSEFDSDAYDALCEMINCINGAYAARLCDKEIEVRLHPPVFYMNTTLEAEKGLYEASFKLGRHEFKLLMVANDKFRLSA